MYLYCNLNVIIIFVFYHRMPLVDLLAPTEALARSVAKTIAGGGKMDY